MENKIDYIYGLYYLDDDIKYYFYVGITNDHERRISEHKVNASFEYVRNCPGGKKGESKKGAYGETAKLPEYTFIRNVLTPSNYTWNYEIIETVKEKDDVQITEDMVIIGMIRDNHPLQNSKAGEGERWDRLKAIADSNIKLTPQSILKWDKKQSELNDEKLIVYVIKLLTKYKKLLKEPGWKNGFKALPHPHDSNAEIPIRRDKRGNDYCIMTHLAILDPFTNEVVEVFEVDATSTSWNDVYSKFLRKVFYILYPDLSKDGFGPQVLK